MTNLEEEQNVAFLAGFQHHLIEGTYLDEYW